MLQVQLMDARPSFPRTIVQKKHKIQNSNSDNASETKKTKRGSHACPGNFAALGEHKFAPIHMPKQELPIPILKCD